MASGHIRPGDKKNKKQHIAPMRHAIRHGSLNSRFVCALQQYKNAWTFQTHTVIKKHHMGSANLELHTSSVCRGKAMNPLFLLHIVYIVHTVMIYLIPASILPHSHLKTARR